MKVVNLQVQVSAPAIDLARFEAVVFGQPIEHVIREVLRLVNDSLSRMTATVSIVGDGQPLDVDTIDPQLLLSCAEYLMQKYQERTK